MTAVRLALESATGFAAAGAYWRGDEGCEPGPAAGSGSASNFPDGEVHWPRGAAVAWAGECWAIEAELSRKTVSRTTAIMRELLTRTGDYGCPAAESQGSRDRPPGALACYKSVCAAALSTVARARDALGVAAARSRSAACRRTPKKKKKKKKKFFF